MNNTKLSVDELVKIIKTMADERYNERFGWSEIVECYTDEEIATELREHHCTGLPIETEADAISHFEWLVGIRSDYAAEIESTAW